MISSATRWLINASSFVALCWIAFVIYGSFANRGIWRIVDPWLATESSSSPAGTFALCCLIGFTPIAAVAWIIWRLFLRGRVGEDFPSATMRR